MCGKINDNFLEGQRFAVMAWLSASPDDHSLTTHRHVQAWRELAEGRYKYCNGFYCHYYSVLS